MKINVNLSLEKHKNIHFRQTSDMKFVLLPFYYCYSVDKSWQRIIKLYQVEYYLDGKMNVRVSLVALLKLPSDNPDGNGRA